MTRAFQVRRKTETFSLARIKCDFSRRFVVSILLRSLRIVLDRLGSFRILSFFQKGIRVGGARKFRENSRTCSKKRLEERKIFLGMVQLFIRFTFAFIRQMIE